MADDYSLAVAVTADLSQFRQQLRAELATARQQGATIPVGATAGAAGTTVVPPGGASVASPGTAQTAAAVATQSTQAIASAVARAGLPAPGAGMYFGSTVYGSGFGSNAAGTPMQAPVNPFTGGPAGAGGINPGPSFGAAPVPSPGRNFGAAPPSGVTPDQWWNYFGGDQGRPQVQTDADQRRYNMRFRALYFANAGARLFSNETEYGRNVRMAGSDPQELIAADVKYRQGIADAFPIAGRFGLALNDMFTGGTEPIERTLRDAERQNEGTALMKSIGDAGLRYADMAAVAGARWSAKTRRSADVQYAAAERDIRLREQQANDAKASYFQGRRARIQTWYDLTPISQGGTEEERDRRLRDIDTAQNDSIAKTKDQFGAMLSNAQAVKESIYRETSRDIDLLNFRNQGAAAASRLRTQNRPFEAGVSERLTSMAADLFTADPETRAGVARRGVQEMAESFVDFARDFGHQQRQITAQQRVTQKLLDRDPVGARIEGIQSDASEAIEAANRLPWGFRQIRQYAIRRGAQQDERLVRREDDDARQLRIQSLDNRKEHYDLLTQNKQYTAQATDIRRQTEEDVSAMQQSKKFSADEIKRRIAEGISQEQSFEAQLRRRQGAEVGVNVREYAPGPGGGGANSMEPVVKGLDAVRLAIEGLRSLLGGS